LVRYFRNNSTEIFREHNTTDWLGKEQNLTIFWAPVLSPINGGVIGAIGVICPVGSNMSCDSDLTVNDTLEDFEALFDSDFQLVED